jgi:hypothetical protein
MMATVGAVRRNGFVHADPLGCQGPLAVIRKIVVNKALSNGAFSIVE